MGTRPKTYAENPAYFLKRSHAWHERVGKPRREANRAFFIEKLGGRCVICGYDAHPSALDFDHRDPSTKMINVSAIMNWKDRDRIWPEVQKCQLLCANCHRIKSIECREIGARRKYDL